MLAPGFHARAQCPSLVANLPFQFSSNSGATQPIIALFSQNLNASTIDTSTFVVHGSQLGYRKNSYQVTNNQAVLFPTPPMLPGEYVTVLLDSSIKSTGGCPFGSDFLFHFRTIGGPGPASFMNTNQVLSSKSTSNVRLGDLDFDGDLDAFLVFEPGSNEVWLNDGFGNFTNSGQALGPAADRTYALDIGDLDADGDIDAVLGKRPGDLEIWLNDGNAVFTKTSQTFGSTGHGGLAIGDLDGDGDLDFYAGRENLSDLIYKNNGAGFFTLHQTMANNSDGTWVAMGDLDADRDLDVIVADRFSTSARVYRNNGKGTFAAWQTLAVGMASISVEAGDLDSDGDLDVLFGNSGQSEVWFNNGLGTLAISPSTFGDGRAVLADFDGDADLDVIQGGTASSRIYINNGLGFFSYSGIDLGVRGRIFNWTGIGDIDGDEDLDVYIARQIAYSDSVWLNQLPCTPPSFLMSPPDSMTFCEGADSFVPTVLSGIVDSLRWHVSTNNGLTWIPIYNDSNFIDTDYDTMTVLNVSAGFQNFQYCAVLYYCNLGGTDTSDAMSLNVNPLPSSSFSLSDSVACKNFPITFSGPGGGLDTQWDFGDLSTDSVQNPVHAYATTGTFEIVLLVTSNATSCVSSDTFNLVVGHVAFDSIHAEDPACSGDTTGQIELYISGISPFLYSGDSGQSYQASGQFTNLPAGTLYFVVADSFGCRKTDSFTLSNPPAITSAFLIASFECNGDSTGAADQTVSNGSQPYQFLWSTGDTTEDLISTWSAWHSVTITDAAGCSSMDSVFIPASNLSASAIIDYVSCKGANDGAINLIPKSGIGAITYLWTNGPTTEDIGNLAPGYYSCMVVDSSGCLTFGSGILPVPDSLPLALVSDTLVCGHENVQFWSHNFTISFDGFDDGILVSDDSLSSESEELTIEAWVYPEGTGSGWRPLVIKSDAAGNGFRLYRDQVAGTLIWLITDSSGSDTLISTSALDTSIWTHIAASYNADSQWIYINGVKDTSNATEILPVPVTDTLQFAKGGGLFLYQGRMDEIRMWSINRMEFGVQGDFMHMLTGDETSLIGYWTFDDGIPSSLAVDRSSSGFDGSLQLMDPNTDWIPGDPLGIQYQWDFGDGDSSLIADPVHSYDDSASSTTQVELIRTFAAGCMDTSWIQLDIVPQPDPVIVSEEPPVVCLLDTIKLTSVAGTAGNIWSTGSNADFIFVDTSGTYIVDAQDSSGCVFSDTVVITFLPFPDPNPIITPHGPVSACNGDSVNLDAGSGYSSYLWNTGDTTQVIQVDSAGKYSVLVTNGFGCTENSDSVEVLTGNSIPVVITQSGDTLYAGTGSTFEWYLFGAPIGGATASFYVPAVEGEYSVVVTDSNGCEGTDSIHFEFGVGVEEIQNSKILVFPNPFTDQITIDPGNIAGKWSMTILDGLGRDVITTGLHSGKITILAYGISDGIYLIRIDCEGGKIEFIKMVKE